MIRKRNPASTVGTTCAAYARQKAVLNVATVDASVGRGRMPNAPERMVSKRSRRFVPGVADDPPLSPAEDLSLLNESVIHDDVEHSIEYASPFHRAMLLLCANGVKPQNSN